MNLRIVLKFKDCKLQFYEKRSPFRLFIARQKLSNALKSLKSKKSLQESTKRASERASERVPFSTSYLQLALAHARNSRVNHFSKTEIYFLKKYTKIIRIYRATKYEGRRENEFWATCQNISNLFDTYS